MAAWRKPRLHLPGGLYHVILRGNNRQDIFFTPDDFVPKNNAKTP